MYADHGRNGTRVQIVCVGEGAKYVHAPYLGNIVLSDDDECLEREFCPTKNGFGLDFRRGRISIADLL